MMVDIMEWGFQININSSTKEQVELLNLVLQTNLDLNGKLYQLKTGVFLIRFGRK
jgi:hypothetical protein